MQTHQHGERFERIRSIENGAASMAAPNGLRDEPLLLLKPLTHLNRHDLARNESRVGVDMQLANENAAVSNIEVPARSLRSVG
jgi:hypothetical protein